MRIKIYNGDEGEEEEEFFKVKIKSRSKIPSKMLNSKRIRRNEDLIGKAKQRRSGAKLGHGNYKKEEKQDI